MDYNKKMCLNYLWTKDYNLYGKRIEKSTAIVCLSGYICMCGTLSRQPTAHPTTKKNNNLIICCQVQILQPWLRCVFVCALYYVLGCARLPWEEVDIPRSIPGKITGHWERLPGTLTERMCPFYSPCSHVARKPRQHIFYERNAWFSL